MARRIYTLTIEVEAPHTTGESEIAAAINEALDEPPCDWGEWTVGTAIVNDIRLLEEEQ